jgi:LPXTG-motif cell wall-anchored protein
MHISVRRALQTAVLASGVVVAGSGLALASPDSAVPSPATRCAEGDVSACASQEQPGWSQEWMQHIPVSTSTPDCPCEEGSETECENPPTTTVPTLPPTTVPPVTSTPDTSTPGTTPPVTTTTVPTGTPDIGSSTPHTPSTVTTSAQHVVHVGGSHRVPPAHVQRTPELANTGVNPVVLLLGGLATIAAGAAAVLFGRRKRA